jgi:hypothetical protein
VTPSLGWRFAIVVAPPPVLIGLACTVSISRRVGDWVLPHNIDPVAAPIAVACAGIVAIAYATQRWATRWLLVATLIFYGLSTAVGVVATPEFYLDRTGTTTVAIVTQEGTHVITRGTKPDITRHVYRFSRSDGAPIAGELTAYDDNHNVGDRVEIVYDPTGFANPQLARVTRESWAGVEIAAILLAITLALAVITCVTSPPGKPRARRRPPEDDPRSHYPQVITPGVTAL